MCNYLSHYLLYELLPIQCGTVNIICEDKITGVAWRIEFYFQVLKTIVMSTCSIQCITGLQSVMWFDHFSIPTIYNPGQKYMVHLENFLVFIIAPCSMIKAAPFPKLGPPPSPHTILLQGGHFECTDPTLYGGRGEGTVEFSKKAKCTITFDQNCSFLGMLDHIPIILILHFNHTAEQPSCMCMVYRKYTTCI